MCQFGSSMGMYASQCQAQGYTCNPKDSGCTQGDASCPSYESQCPAKCCQKNCCGAYGYPPGDVDMTCCDAAYLCMDPSCDSRCNLRCDSPIKWTAHPTFVLDVSGFDGPKPPKKVIIWNRPDGNFNDNEYFVRDNSNPSQTQGGEKGWITWHDLCLEAASASNGAAVTVNTCSQTSDKYNPLQQWDLVKTADGSKIQVKNTNKCINVADLLAKNGQPVGLWECNNDKMQSFDVQQNEWYPGVTTVSV